jgi:hypothetical protein
MTGVSSGERALANGFLRAADWGCHRFSGLIFRGLRRKIATSGEKNFSLLWKKNGASDDDDTADSGGIYSCIEGDLQRYYYI